MGTQITSIACNNCGAALQVSDATRFATCTYCNSQLAVHRTDSAAYTEVLHAVKQNTDRIAEDVYAIRTRAELDAMDRAWQTERKAYLMRDSEGKRVHPGNAKAAIALTFVIMLFGLTWVIVTAAMEPDRSPILPIPLWPIGVVIMVAGFVVGLTTHTKAKRYVEEERAYKRRRQEIENRGKR